MVLRPLGNALAAGRSTGLRYVCQALVQSGPLPRAPRDGGGPRAAWWRGGQRHGTCVGALRRSYFYPPHRHPRTPRSGALGGPCGGPARSGIAWAPEVSADARPPRPGMTVGVGKQKVLAPPHPPPRNVILALVARTQATPSARTDWQGGSKGSRGSCGAVPPALAPIAQPDRGLQPRVARPVGLRAGGREPGRARRSHKHALGQRGCGRGRLGPRNKSEDDGSVAGTATCTERPGA